jgi:hypothetical protein
MSWERGRAEIERLIGDGELERVAPSAPFAERLLADATAHVNLAAKGIGPDRSANLLEVIVLVTAEGDEAIIHAMPLRAVYRRLLDP